jgi:hypothetical protein
MIGNNDNINWIGTSLEDYISVKLEDKNSVNFYFTKSLLSITEKKYPDFFDKEDNKYNLMVGFDEDNKKILLGLSKKENIYTSAFTLNRDENSFKGKPKKITNQELRNFIENSVKEDKFKLVDYDLELKDDDIIITFYLDSVVYY